MKLIRFVGLILLVLSSSAWAQTYPDKSKVIKIIVPFGPGSGTDLFARAVGNALNAKSGVAVIIDNKPGAEGVIGMSAAKSSPPDGYTMVMGNIGTQVLNVHMLPNLAYDPVADFIPVYGMAKFTNVLNATASLPYKGAREFIEAAKKNPGKYRFGSATTMTRLQVELLQKLAGIELEQIPYRSMADATTALVRGEIDVLMNDAITADPFYKAGRIHPLAVAGAERMARLPDVPTFREQGVKDYEFTGWIAVYFPAKTPTPIVTAMQELLKDALKAPNVTETMARAAYEPLNLSGQQLIALQRADSDKVSKLVGSAPRQPR